MKYVSNYEIAMIGNLSTLTEDTMKRVLMDKGDVEIPDIFEAFDDSFEMPNGKSMKRANRQIGRAHV